MSTDQCDRSIHHLINQETFPMSEDRLNAPTAVVPGVPRSTPQPTHARRACKRETMVAHVLQSRRAYLCSRLEKEHLRRTIKAVGELYRRREDLRAQRVSRGRRASRRRATLCGVHYGPVPFGYSKSANGRLILNHDAMVVRWVFELRAHGSSLTAIVERLRAAEVRHPRGKQWQRYMVTLMLQRPIYIGLLDSPRPEGCLVSMPTLRIVPENVWHMVQSCR